MLDKDFDLGATAIVERGLVDDQQCNLKILFYRKKLALAEENYGMSLM